MEPPSNNRYLESTNTQLPDWETPRGKKERPQQRHNDGGPSLQERVSRLKARLLGKVNWNLSKEGKTSGSHSRNPLVRIGLLILLLVLIAIALGVGLGLGLRYDNIEGNLHSSLSKPSIVRNSFSLFLPTLDFLQEILPTTGPA